ncbi:hypothetical protein [Curtobacterium sp. MCSS17_016]|uniref:hypothetical protein n=1 Tax=Curtobacterium sp. MCSS17_016 TaxID=2175644 RepID=UPI0011B68CBC|nr:hypothetical protein [Curtobacterium sp. MCSS17_016]WIE80991.1 hypothetical protein DEJ19_020960 [Curtobacterium sp. MCSS17_016]
MVEELVHFRRMDQPEFDRVVEALLIEEHSRPGLRVHALDGRGGDGGVDVGVWDSFGALVHVFQLKFFPEGFSGLMSKRRQQVKKSFDTAWELHHPPMWTLVIPRNASREESDYVHKLGDGKNVEVRIIGQAELDVLLAKHPHIHDRFFTDKTRDYLQTINRPEEALAAAGDIAAVMGRVFGKLQSRSAHWGSDVRLGADGTVRETLVGLTPDAHLREPLTMHLTAEFGEDTTELRDEFDKAMRFGLAEPVVLPGAVVKSFVRTGAPWFEGDDPVEELHLLPGDAGAGTPVTLIAQDASGRKLQSVVGTVRRFARGSEGSQMVVDVEGGLLSTWVLPDDPTTGASAVTFEMVPDGAPVRKVRRLGRFLDVIDDADHVLLRIDGRDYALFSFGPGESHRPTPALMAFLDDLLVLEDEFDVEFIFPADGVSTHERLWVATLREMVRGAAAPVPGVDAMTFTLSATPSPEFVERLRGDDTTLLLQERRFEMEVLGVNVYVGDVLLHQAQCSFEDGAAHADAIEAGEGAGRQVRVRGVNNIPWIVYRHNVDASADGPMPLHGWGLEDVPEHPGLERLQQMRATSRGAAE